MRSKSLPALAAVLALAACSPGGDDDESTPTTTSTEGCALAADVVAEAVGHEVVVEREPSGRPSCAYLHEGGSRVEVSRRSLADEGFAAVLAEVEADAGPTVALGRDAVDGAERGWIAVVGRAVQVGAASGEDLVLVAVADPDLDAEAAREVAEALAGEALDG